MSRSIDERLRLVVMTQGVNLAFEAIAHNLFLIGEDVKALPGEVVDQDPGIPRGEIAAMRDVIGHHYHRIVPAIIHRTVESDLASLKAAVIAIRQRRGGPNGQNWERFLQAAKRDSASN